MNGTGSASESSSPRRCSSAQQQGPGSQPATARMKWNKEVNKVVMECFYTIRPFDEVGIKKIEYRKKIEPRWKRKIEGDIKRLRQDLNVLERELKGELGEKKILKLFQLHERYRVTRKSLRTVMEELKQSMIAKSAKIRFEQFRQNRLFEVDKRKYTQNLTEEEKDQVLFLMQKKANNFGVISGVLEKNTTKRQNG